jgi:polyketide synthase
MSRVLVTGANGFIGSHIVKKFIAEGDEVVSLVRATSDISLIKECNSILCTGDITNPESLNKSLQKINIVIHVAGLASDWGPYSDFERINLEGTKNLLQAASSAGVHRFVHISSVAPHGFGRRDVREDDSMPQSPFAYVETKRLAEKAVFDFAASSDMEVTAIRPGNVFGPDDHTFIDQYLAAICEGKIALINGGRAWTCPTYIGNLVDAVWLVSRSEGAVGQAFLITDGLEIDWLRFTTDFARALGKKDKFISVPYGFVLIIATLMEKIYQLFKADNPPLLTRYRIMNGGRDYHFSIDKAREILGYNPRISFDEAVKETVNWYIDNFAC